MAVATRKNVHVSKCINMVYTTSIIWSQLFFLWLYVCCGIIFVFVFVEVRRVDYWAYALTCIRNPLHQQPSGALFLYNDMFLCITKTLDVRSAVLFLVWSARRPGANKLTSRIEFVCRCSLFFVVFFETWSSVRDRQRRILKLSLLQQHPPREKLERKEQTSLNFLPFPSDQERRRKERKKMEITLIEPDVFFLIFWLFRAADNIDRYAATITNHLGHQNFYVPIYTILWMAFNPLRGGFNKAVHLFCTYLEMQCKSVT